MVYDVKLETVLNKNYKQIIMNRRQKAKEWNFPRRAEFENELRNSSTIWFEKQKFQVHNKMS